MTIRKLAVGMMLVVAAFGCAQAETERIGVYDSRAVVVSYAGSDLFIAIVQEGRAKFEAVKAAGDEDLVDAFNPNEKQRGYAEAIQEKPPIPLEELEH